MGTKKFANKKLLMLGTNVGSVEIVKYAQSEGAYVIVTDYLPTEKSAAKQIADETAMISTTDIKALCEFAREKHVDGVFCGVSERNLLSVHAVAKELGLRCYFTMEQWDHLANKEAFKSTCEQYQIPVPQKFELSPVPTEDELGKIEYPVIVKPVDQGAAIGIHICHNREELLAGHRDAIQKSHCGQDLVEDYIKGTEFSAYYTFINGECRTSIIFDKHLASGSEPQFIPLPECYAFPSAIQDEYLEKYDEKVRSMFLGLGIKNGVACIQGVTDGRAIGVFEAGLRMGGTALYRFIDHINGANFMKMMTNYALTGEMGGDIDREDVTLKGKHGCILSLLNRGGKIKEIQGYEEASKLKDVIYPELRYKVGDTVPANGTLKQSHIRFFIVSDSAKELADTINEIKRLIHVKDKDGNEMIYSDFDPSRLKG